MKKRLFAVVLCLALALTCLLAFAACKSGDDGKKDNGGCTHGNMTWIDEVAASCTATGTVGHYHCAECGKNFDQSKNELADLTIPFAHSKGSEWLTENDKHYHACLNGCGAKLDETPCFGEMHYSDEGHWIVCEVCGKDTAILSHDHTARKVDTLASCTEGGYTTYFCSCGHSYVDDETEAGNHKFAENAWESADGWHWHPAICGCEDERGGYEPHSYVPTVTVPGCETQGYTTYTCECGESYVADYVPAKGHAVSEWTETGSTPFDASKCEYSVSYRGMCSRCNTEQTKTELVERHSFFERVTQAATCIGGGFKGTFCANEGCKYHANAYKEESYFDSTAHTWIEDTANSDPEKGVTAYKCSASTCHATKKISTGTTAGVSKEELGNVSEVELKDATIGIGAIKDAIGQNNVNISAGIVDKNDVTLTDEQKEMLGDGKIYNFTITTEDNQSITNFGENMATVRIRYELKPTDDPNHIIVWYIVENAEGEDGLEAIEAVYSEDENGVGYVTFQTKHFSYYTVTHVAPHLLCEKLKKHDDRHLHVVEPTCMTDGYTICLRCGKEVEGSRVEAKGHMMGETVVSEATCGAHGLTRHSCANCSLSFEAVTPALGHDYVLSAQVTATCKTQGSLTYTCIHCDTSYTQTLRKLTHVYHTTEIAPTCSAGGYTEKTCTACGEVTTSRHTPAVGHKEGSVWYQNEGGHYHVCTVCGEKMSEAAHVPGPAATEQTAQICTTCGYMLAAPIVHTHSLTKVNATAATCTLGGNIEYYTCACGAWFADASATMLIADHTSVIVDAKGHTPTATEYVEPTCENVGYTAGVWCEDCKTYLRGHVELSAYGHDWHQITQAPTCTEKGSVTYKCSYCNETDETATVELEALGHTIVSVVTAPTCTERGYTTHTCLRCKTHTVDTYVDALDHKYATVYQSNANGHWHTCIRCDVTDTVEAHNPDYKEATTEHGIKCVKCNYVIADALEHTHQNPQSVAAVNPTCTASGNIGYYICSCGDWFYDEACTQPIYNRASVLLNPIGHSLTYHADQKATCTEVGYTSGAYCSGCQTWLTGHTEIPQLGHSFSETFLSDANGHWHKCERCAETTQAASHNYNANVTAPTCKDGGYTTYICADCGHTYVGDETQPVAHAYENGKCKWCGTPEPQKPVDPNNPTVVYRWEESNGNGETMVYLFYSNGEIVATYQGMSMTAYWIEKDGFVWLYEDAAHTQFIGKATPNADGTVTPWQCKEHNYVLTEKTDATCDQGASEYYECTECGDGYGHGTAPLGHELGEDGRCIRCKKTQDEINESGGIIKPDDGQIRKYKIEILSRMEEEWRRTISRNPAAEEAFREQYEEICSMIENAREIGEIDEIYNHNFRSIIDQIGSVDIVEEFRQNVLENMANAWKEATASNPTAEATYKNQYESIRSMVRKASTVEDIEELFFGQFQSMINQIMNQGETPSDKPVYTYTHHVFDIDGTLVSKMDLKFYKDGKVTVNSEYGTLTYSWSERDGLVFVFAEEAMQPMLTLVVDKDGNLSEYVCKDHDMELVESRLPNCMNDGYDFYVCKICGHEETYTFPSDPTAHRYEDGYCYWCGVSDGSDVNDTPIINEEYTYKYVSRFERDGYVFHEIYLFLGDGTVQRVLYQSGKMVSRMASGYWSNDGELVRRYSDEEYKEFLDAYTIGDDGTTLTLWEVEEEKKVLYEYSTEYKDDYGVSYREEYQFFSDGTVHADLYMDGKWIMDAPGYWEHHNDVIWMYQDAEHTELAGVYAIGDDGRTLYEWECGEDHDYVLVVDRAPTCTRGGETRYECTRCGAGEESYAPALGHDYNKNGICDLCGKSEKIDGDVVYEFAWDNFEDAPEDDDILRYREVYKFLADGTVDARAYSEAGAEIGDAILYWSLDGELVRMYYNPNYTELMEIFIVVGDGKVEPWEGCDEHQWEVISATEPTCTQPGYYTAKCVVCRATQGTSMPALGHETDADGKCTRCGEYVGDEEPVDFLKYMLQMLEQMDSEWRAAVTDYVVEATYRPQYEEYYAMVERAKSVEEINAIYTKMFKPLIRKVINASQTQPTDQVEKSRSEILEKMDKEWDTLSMEVGFATTEAYRMRYEMLRDEVKNAKSVEEINAIYNEFAQMVFAIRNQGGEPGVSLDDYKAEMLNQMANEWDEAYPVNPAAAEAYKGVYQELRKQIENAESIEVIDKIYNGEFAQIIRKILNAGGEPTTPTVVYTCEQVMEDGSKMVYRFYSNGEIIATYMGMSMTAYWIEKDGYVYLYEDAAHTELAGKAIINGDGTVTPVICEEHNYVLIEQRDATCTEGSYEAYECTECGSGYAQGGMPLGHEYGEDGYCGRCGTHVNDEPDVDAELEKYKEEIKDQMYREFMKAVTSADMQKQYQAHFDMLCEQLANATSYDEAQFVYEVSFKKLLDEIYSIGGQDEISHIQHPFGDFFVMQGDDVEEFIAKNLLYHDLYVYYYDGSMTSMSITRDMIDTMGYDFNNMGSVIFYINYNGYQTPVYISVDAGCMHEGWMNERIPSTCTTEGYVREYCRDCGKVFSYQPIPKQDHIYVDGVCHWCGISENDPLASMKQSVLAEMSERWNELLNQGTMISDTHYQIYNEIYEQIKSAMTERQITQLYKVDFTELLALIHSGTEPGVCMHNNIATERLEPTCTMDGYVRNYCMDCGAEMSYNTLFASGHYYVNGKCMNCGEIDGVVDESLQKAKEEVWANMTTDWHQLMAKYDIGEDYQDRLDEIFAAVGQATSLDAVIKLYKVDYFNLREEVTANCEMKPEEPKPDAEIVYEMTYAPMEGVELYYVFYSNGELVMNGMGMTQTLYWVQRDSELHIYEDAMHVNFCGKAIVDENGNVTPVICGEKHNYALIESVDSSCTAEGYYKYQCIDCGTTYTEYNGLRAHECGENGRCIYCGLLLEGNGEEDTEAELERFRKEILSKMTEEWERICSEFNLDSEHHNRYKALYSRIRTASSIENVKMLYHGEFYGLLEEIRNGNGGSTEVWVECVEPMFPTHYTVNRGSDLDKFIAEMFLLSKQYLCLYYSNGETETVYLTRDMFTVDYGSMDELGEMRLLVSYNANGGYMCQVGIYINVIKDMSNEKLVATYTFDAGFADANTLYLDLYANGEAVAKIDDEQTVGTYVMEGSVIRLTMDGMTLLFNTHEDGTMSAYQPTEPLINTYSYSGVLQIEVYGKYNGAGDYMARLIANGYVMFTGYVTLDLEKGTISSPMLGEGELDIDENGNLGCNHDYVLDERAPTCTESGYKREYCNKCGSGYGTDIAPLDHSFNENNVCIRCGVMGDNGDIDHETDDVERTRKEVLNMIYDEWDRLLEEYIIGDTHHQTYQKLQRQLKMAKTSDELWSLYENDFMNLMWEIEETCARDEFESAVINVEYGFDTNFEVVEGSDVEEFLKNNLLGKILYLYCADGTVIEVPLTRDMMNLSNTSFAELGETEIEILYLVDGGYRSLYIYIDVQMDFSKSVLLGSYTYKNDEGALVFELYDNGYALMTMVSEDYSDTTSMPYRLNGNLLYFNMDSVTLVMELSEGTATMYVPKTETIGSYTYQGVALDVYGPYTGAGEYVAVGTDGYQTLSFLVQLDLENGKIIATMLSRGELTIGEGGELYCDHEYEEIVHEPSCNMMGFHTIICVHCGESTSTTLPSLGHSFDENGICTACGMNDNGGFGGGIVISPIYPENGSGNIYYPSVNENGEIIYSPTVNNGTTNGDFSYSYTDTTLNGNVAVIAPSDGNYYVAYDVTAA